ncbi:MAG: hypothetical protein WBL20_09605, partial [Sphingobium sp.]
SLPSFPLEEKGDASLRWHDGVVSRFLVNPNAALTKYSAHTAIPAAGDMRTGQGMKQALVALAMMGVSHAASAQPAVRLDTQMFVERVSTDLNGRPRRTLESAARAAPGEPVIVILHWRNEGAQPVRSFAASRTMLRGLTPDLTAPGVQVSIDGGRSWDRFDRLWLPTPLGGIRRAVAEDVTHVRWLLPDAAGPGQAGRLSYRSVAR